MSAIYSGDPWGPASLVTVGGSGSITVRDVTTAYNLDPENIDQVLVPALDQDQAEIDIALRNQGFTDEGLVTISGVQYFKYSGGSSIWSGILSGAGSILRGFLSGGQQTQQSGVSTPVVIAGVAGAAAVVLAGVYLIKRKA